MTTDSFAEHATLDEPDIRDQSRGTLGMALFITTEAALFATLFFSYFYLQRERGGWPADELPKVVPALRMLAILLVSSATLWAGEQFEHRRRLALARVLVVLTIVLGVAFLFLQAGEYRERLRVVAPWTDAYGSIFYTITTFHALHLCVGLCFLAFAAIVPRLGETRRAPHRSLHNAALYWHFVDVVWVAVVLVLYVVPNVGGAS